MLENYNLSPENVKEQLLESQFHYIKSKHSKGNNELLNKISTQKKTKLTKTYNKTHDKLGKRKKNKIKGFLLNIIN